MRKLKFNSSKILDQNQQKVSPLDLSIDTSSDPEAWKESISIIKGCHPEIEVTLKWSNATLTAKPKDLLKWIKID